MATIRRPTLYKMVDILYEYHFKKTSSLYPVGTATMIEATIRKIACMASIEHCERQISSLKENKRKPIYSGERFTDELVYWITVREIIKNKMI